MTPLSRVPSRAPQHESLPMKVAYVTIFDATDVRNWSGLDFHIWKALEAEGADIELIGNLSHGRSVGRKLRKLLGTHIERRSFLHVWDVDTARDYARDVADRVSASRPDVILSPSPIPLAYLTSSAPRVLWTDATFAGLASFYPEFLPQNVSRGTTRSGREMDRHSLRNCDLLIYSSDWAAKTARSEYPSCADKLHVVPYGANIEVRHTAVDVENWARERSGTSLRLLFIGMDWERKGGAHAVSVVAALNAKGIPAELIAVGAMPPPEVRCLPFVRALGVIDKSTIDGRDSINELLRTSHFLILPSLAECCAVVLAEACAFGIPIIATDVGGMGTIVQPEFNGRLFKLGCDTEIWVEWISATLARPAHYLEMSLSAFADYERRLNWSVAARTVLSLICEKVKSTAGACYT